MIVAALAGCSSLPRDGPSGRAVTRGADGMDSLGGYAIVELDYAASERIKAVPAARLTGLAVAGDAAATDLIGEGDTLSVTIYEPSGALFGGRSLAGGVQGANETLGGIVVDRNGSILVPFAGQVRVAGLNPTEAAGAIRRALQGRVGNPQVIVGVTGNAYNSVVVLGEVKTAGRVPLTINADRVLDVIAAAGGASRPVQDVEVVIQRGDRTFSAPLSQVTGAFGENVRLARGDQVNVVYKPRRYSTFGALGAVARTDMPPGEVTLAAAVSTVGGLDDTTADARSVLVFRFERPEVAAALGLTQPPTPRGVPVVYRLNLAEASGFFVAGNFAIQPEDIVYVPRAGYAEARKFFEFVQSITRVIYDVSVTSTLNVD